MSINAIGSNIPIEVAFGGLGVDTLTQYGVIYGNGTNPVGVTAVGTNLDVLKSNGPGFAPTFQPLSVIPGGGAWVFIETQTAAASASLNFTTGLGSFETYIFIVNGFISTTPDDTLLMNVSINGGASWISTYPWGGRVIYIGGISTTWNIYPSSAGLPGIVPMSPNLMPTTGAGLSGTYFFYGANVATASQQLRGEWLLSPDEAGTYDFGLSAAAFQDGSVRDVNAFQLKMALGDIATGTVTLYGLTQ